MLIGKHGCNMKGVAQETGAKLRDEVVQGITTESETFRVQATGEVGDSRVEIRAILSYANEGTGQILYWSVQ